MDSSVAARLPPSKKFPATIMAKSQVCGKPLDEIREMRAEHEASDSSVPFEQKYCLAKIPCQPDDYDGPQRYCVSDFVIQASEDVWLCNKHGGATDLQDQYDISQHDGQEQATNAIKHGMKATQENLMADFDDKDEALYKWVMTEYPRAYDIDFDEDPSAQMDLHRLAVEMVRAERGRGWLIEEGEVHEKEVRDEDGRVVVNDGEIVTEKSEHYLAQMLHRQDKKITSLEKELGITRKEQLRQDSTDDAVEAIKNFAEVGADLLARDTQDYEPDEWDND